MRSHTMFVRAACCVVGLAGLIPAAAEVRAGDKIEAVKGKHYRLIKQRGPWMIMVTNLRANTPEGFRNAAKAADELVYELRTAGIPAYVFRQEGFLEPLDTRDRAGRSRRRAYAAQRNQIAVLAGNFPTIDEKKRAGRAAQGTLKWIKKMKPKSLSGGYFRPTKGKPNPLSRAFLTTNPLLSSEGISRLKDNTLLKQLNKGKKFSLLDNPGKYSLVVASFHGTSKTAGLKPGLFSRVTGRGRDTQFAKHTGLDDASLHAWQLVRLMRQQGLDAWVLHKKFKSVVTVGSFDTPKSPEIRRIADRFRAKYKPHPQTGETVFVAESIQMAAIGKGRNAMPAMHFPMDPQPQLIRVPLVN